ncbi:prolipoprotein diacylglyceryl transferase [Oxobacter pfennigii]|uniref:Phosphatidylglycerol--prolipoprotein diacylglyceryl transferase n=1 Tax=Oxobacter pfennigii TaxID=36849 RepID=A0A0P8W1D2_9CLOT|nr:prolipoprotein diacylglyceryl transferase [Oxobacter pfennigii]KPU42214.1 prolipoprotein diacylglyceryl transferase [Oxobacter pfennigii]
MDPVAFSINGLEIRWYGVIIASGMFIGTILAIIESRRVKFDENIIYDIVLLCVPSAIVGARLYYVIFEWNYYKDKLLEAIDIRQGGLAIHGGIIAAVLAAIIYTRIKKADFFKAADICAPSMILGQAIGRWGNFFNQEAHGGAVSKEFISRFPQFIQEQMYINGVYYHPTFLYESLWNFAIFIILLFYRRKSKVTGETFMLYIIFYSVGRFFIEGLRTDSLMIGSFRTAQITSIVLILLGITGIVILRKVQLRKI